MAHCQHLRNQRPLHYGIQQIHILDEGLSLYPWEHTHSLKDEEAQTLTQYQSDRVHIFLFISKFQHTNKPTNTTKGNLI